MKNRWLFRHSCRSTVERYLDAMVDKYFKKNDKWTTRKEDLEYWKIAMRVAASKYMDQSSTKQKFSQKFVNFLTHHNLRGAIIHGKELSK